MEKEFQFCAYTGNCNEFIRKGSLEGDTLLLFHLIVPLIIGCLSSGKFLSLSLAAGVGADDEERPSVSKCVTSGGSGYPVGLFCFRLSLSLFSNLAD